MDNNDENISEDVFQRLSSSSGPDTSDRSGSSNSSFSLVRSETRAVKISKAILVVALIISAVVVGVLTYMLLSNEERNDFELKFHEFAQEISQLVHHEARSVFQSASALSSAVTSYALEKDASWPLVSLPHFEVQGSHTNEISNSLLTSFSPLVAHSARAKWETYSVQNQGWIKEGVNLNIKLHDGIVDGNLTVDPISANIFRFDNEVEVVENDEGPYLPVWQVAPAPRGDSTVNFNLLSHPVFSRVYRRMLNAKQAVLSQVTPLDFFFSASVSDNVTHPHSFLLQPVYKDFRGEYNATDIVGTIISILPWDHYFMNLLPEGSKGVSVILFDTCDQAFTYIINGREALYVGPGDLHDRNYDNLVVTTDFDVDSQIKVSTTKEHCEFFLNIYPTSQLEEEYQTNRPMICTLVVLAIFAFATTIFFMYDVFVERRQEKVMVTAKQSNAIVSSIFPSNVRDRMMKEAQGNAQAKEGGGRGFPVAKNEIKSFLEEPGEDETPDAFESKPIADLFPSATVMFADLVGFTAWSSVREPSQVFQLLETLYHAFDEIARRRRVFKVETIGDCYVAVTGLPEPRKDHAVVMARFARDCLTKTNDLTKKLELSLGPDTADLCMRIGLNSGPVTAGVLRGDKSRFQLFGDTVNTAARMESNGTRNMIHISQETANLLEKAGKSHWLLQREDKVVAKGKGELQTYWLQINIQSSPSATSGTTMTSDTEIMKPDNSNLVQEAKKSERSNVSEGSESSERSKSSEENQERGLHKTVVERVRQAGLTESVRQPLLSDKVERLVSWNSDVLARLLKQIVARRNASRSSVHASTTPRRSLQLETEDGATVIHEVKEIITLPRFDAKAMRRQEDAKKVILPPEVTAQLHDYVTIIATMYRDNPFHNFEHASHVTMSVVKLLSRIVAPDDVFPEEGDTSGHFDRNLHDHTYGITSDPLTQFAVVFSALIHDVDHSGVPNAQLIKEHDPIAEMYKNKSVAEQNSVDIAWHLLMDDAFEDLRSVIYTNQSELDRFRQLVVNSVMATDIVDKELKELRNGRWDKAFRSELHRSQTPEDVNRKATIVIEHLIQASDIAHTMQHWHIYRKWNERFFQEMYHAYKCGRAEKNPIEFWYKGEIGFFDFYIIPLAKKLKDCGVFGVSCDEYLNYAMANRKEWELKGERVVAEMAGKYRGKRFSYLEDQCKLGEEKTGSKRFHDKF